MGEDVQPTLLHYRQISTEPIYGETNFLGYGALLEYYSRLIYQTKGELT